jgi:hypothetical protein
MDKKEMVNRIKEQDVQIVGLLAQIKRLDDAILELHNFAATAASLMDLFNHARKMYPEVDNVYTSLKTKDRIIK